MNKKGMELSINFIVMLILAIAVFGGGLAFINKFFSIAQDEEARLDQETTREIEKLLNDGSKIGIPMDSKEVTVGKPVVYGLGIYNILPGEKRFRVEIEFGGKENQEREVDSDIFSNIDNCKDYVGDHWIFDVYNVGKEYTIKHNTRKSIPIQIELDSTVCDSPNIRTTSGTYIFNVIVRYDAAADPSVEDWVLYDGHIHKLYAVVR
jgi:hypothetical protein